MQSMVRFVGRRFMRKQADTHTGSGGTLDVKLGLALFKDGRVPLSKKLLAMGGGVALTAGAVALELPLEAAIALLVPALGLAADVVVDGIEAVAGPVLIAAMLLPRLAPSATVQAIRDERAFPS